MAGMDLPILSVIFLLPILATLPTYYIGKVNEGYSKWLGTIVSGAVLVLSVVAWFFYETPAAGGFSFVESYDWIPYLGVKFIVGVDGLGFPLILLTTYKSLWYICLCSSSPSASLTRTYIPPLAPLKYGAG